MILVLLVIPIYLLYHFTDDPQHPQRDFRCIGVLLVFTLAFSACISLFTSKKQLLISYPIRTVLTEFSGAKRHEILAASAA